MHRRNFLGGALALLGASSAAAGSTDSTAELAAYGKRLQAGLDRTGGGRFLHATEAALHGAHNRIRRERRLTELAPHDGLALAARAQAADLAIRGYLAHRSPEGYGPGDRVGLLARTFIGLPGENLVDFTGSYLGVEPEALMTSWMDSPGHRQNILTPTYTHLGVGAVQAGRRTVAAAVFGQSFAELPRPLPLQPAPAEIAGALAAATPGIRSYDLSPVGGAEREGAFSAVRAPDRLPRGAYALRPRLESGRQYTIVFGPIVILSA